MKDGEIVQVGTPHEFLTNPVNDFVREFVGNKQVPVRLEELMVRLQMNRQYCPKRKLFLYRLHWQRYSNSWPRLNRLPLWMAEKWSG